MTITTVIMADSRRADYAHRLAGRLDTTPTIVWSEGGTIWQTARRALTAHDGADYVCVLQEDAVVSARLIETVAEILENHPGRCLNLYLGKVKPQQPQVRRWMLAADDMGATLIDAKGPFWGVATVIPTVHVEPFVGWGDNYQNAGQSFDGRLTAWSQVSGIRWLYTWPSLVDHDDRAPSLHSSTQGRVAHRFIGTDATGLGSDWTKVQGTTREALHKPVWFEHVTTGRKRKVGKFDRHWERLTRHGTWREIG